MSDLHEQRPNPSPTRDDVESIIVVHGFGGMGMWMLPLCRRLRARGFRVLNWRYPSLFGSVETHANRFRDYLTGELLQQHRVHIVAHSMGSIVVRAALAKGAIANLGRLVFMAPPNLGTPWARKVERLIGRVFFRGIVDLSDRPDSFVNGLPCLSEYDVGIIAAKFDYLVPLTNTFLHSGCDRVVLNATHSSLLLSRSAVNVACSFIATGRFETDA